MAPITPYIRCGGMPALADETLISPFEAGDVDELEVEEGGSREDGSVVDGVVVVV